MPRHRPVAVALPLAALVVVLGGCLPFPGQTAGPVDVGASLQAAYIVTDAARPADLAFAGDGRVFYTEKETGRIRVIQNDVLLDEPLAQVAVNFAGERGLLGIALHPQFDTNGRVYAFYSRSDTGRATDDPQAILDNRVVYFVADGNTAPAGEVFVTSLPGNQTTEHVGGWLAFAPDGTLLVALGDLTDPTVAQDGARLGGKVLRFNDDGSIPRDNPDPDSAVFARGLRDARGFCIDPGTGDAFVIDRNANGHEEVNRVLANRNLGWPEVVGAADTAGELDFATANADYADPLFDSGDKRPRIAGAAFNPSTRYGSSARLNIYYAEANDNRIIALALAADRSATAGAQTFATGLPGTLVDVAFTAAGTLYVASEDSIFRLEPTR